MTTPDIFIFVVPQTLSDGSKVFDVKVGTTTFQAVTRDDAFQLAEKIREAVDDHTNNIAGVREVQEAA